MTDARLPSSSTRAVICTRSTACARTTSCSADGWTSCCPLRGDVRSRRVGGVLRPSHLLPGRRPHQEPGLLSAAARVPHMESVVSRGIRGAVSGAFIVLWLAPSAAVAPEPATAVDTGGHRDGPVGHLVRGRRRLRHGAGRLPDLRRRLSVPARGQRPRRHRISREQPHGRGSRSVLGAGDDRRRRSHPDDPSRRGCAVPALDVQGVLPEGRRRHGVRAQLDRRARRACGHIEGPVCRHRRRLGVPSRAIASACRCSPPSTPPLSATCKRARPTPRTSWATSGRSESPWSSDSRRV